MSASPPTWLLLRGLVRERRHWGPFAARLAHRLGRVHVHCEDLPGNGKLCRERSPAAIDGHVEALRGQLAQGSPQAGPCWVLAESFGGMVAMEWLNRHPRELAGLVLVNTSIGRVSGPHERLRPQAAATIARLYLGRSSPEEREAAILELISNLRPDKDRIARQWARYAREYPTRPGNALRQLWAAARYRAPAELPRRPVLVARGLGDRLVDPDCSAELARHYDWPLVTHPAAGHDLALDAPDWLLGAIERWWRPLQDLDRDHARG